VGKGADHTGKLKGLLKEGSKLDRTIAMSETILGIGNMSASQMQA
jgi:hypothetical protein